MFERGAQFIDKKKARCAIESRLQMHLEMHIFNTVCCIMAKEEIKAKKNSCVDVRRKERQGDTIP